MEKHIIICDKCYKEIDIGEDAPFGGKLFWYFQTLDKSHKTSSKASDLCGICKSEIFELLLDISHENIT